MVQSHSRALKAWMIA